MGLWVGQVVAPRRSAADQTFDAAVIMPAGGPGTGRCGCGSLTEAAQAAARTKGTYLGAHHAQVRGRRGTQKAIGATRHDILVAYYHIVRDKVPYQDLGPDRNDRRRSTEQQTRRLVRQLERLGVNVTIESSE